MAAGSIIRQKLNDEHLEETLVLENKLQNGNDHSVIVGSLVTPNERTASYHLSCKCKLY